MAQQPIGMWRHTFTEALAITVLAGLGEYAHGRNFWPTDNAILGSILTLSSVGVGVLLILVVFNLWSERRAFRFADFGKINGKWLDAIYDEDGDLILGTVIHMTCSVAHGFSVDGWSYTLDELRKLKASSGQTAQIELGNRFFKGHGAPWPDGRGCYYRYEGKEGGKDNGVGYYEFRFESPAKDDPIFDGGFLSEELEGDKHISARMVRGTKVKDLKRYKTDHGKTLLLEFLESQPKKLKRRPVGSSTPAARI